MSLEKDNTDAPISIIITTLAAQAYNNEVDLYTALKNIITSMPSLIERDVYGNFVISNPVMSSENFADKWNENSEKVNNFFSWLERVRKDIIYDPLSLMGISQISKPLKRAFGEKITNKALNRFGDNIRVKRENKELYVSGLTEGLTTNKRSTDLQIVRDHTFYGSK